MINRAEIKSQAKAALSAQYGNVLGMNILYAVIVAVLSSVTVGIAGFILAGPLTAALSWGMLCFFRGNPCSISEAFSRGFDNVGRKIGGYLWMELWIFLWSLLFFIPGIVKSFSYAMTPYILADMPDITAGDALKLSMRMMDGHKGELFVLYLSFIGWALLSGLTFGLLALLYVNPYTQLTFAGFYDRVKEDAIRRGILVQTPDF